MKNDSWFFFAQNNGKDKHFFSQIDAKR